MSIIVKDVCKSYGSDVILDKINLEINKGEIIGLVGPNGAGKTTLMKIIVGLTKQYEGEVLLNDLVLSEFLNNDFTKVIGSLINDPSLINSYTGKQNLKFFHDYFKKSDLSFESQFNNLVEVLDLEKFINKKVSKYSMGMKQRLAIAVSAMSNPDFLILDEPTNGMDLDSIKSLENYLKANDKGVLISSHQLSIIESFSDRVYAISNGTIIGELNLKELKGLEFTIITINDMKSDSVIYELFEVIKVIDCKHYVLLNSDDLYKNLEQLTQSNVEFKINNKSITDLFYEGLIV